MEHRFFYHATAVGLSGTITHPTATQLGEQASCALGPSGGQGTSRVQTFHLGSLVSFSDARSEVSGFRDDDGRYRTVARSIVVELDVLGIVKADHISCALAAAVSGKELPSIMVLEVQVENLRVNGHPVECRWNHDVQTELTTYQSIRDKAKKDESFRVSTPIDLDAKESSTDYDPVLCTILQQMKTEAPYVRVVRNVAEIPNFGRLSVGEMLVCRNSRTLTMLRFQLGSPVRGEVAVSSTGANGVRYP